MTSVPPPGYEQSPAGHRSYHAPNRPPAVEDRLSRRLLQAAGLLSVLLIAVVANALLEGGDENPLNPIARAAERTQQTSGGKMEIQAVYTAPGLASSMTMTGSGEYNTRSGRSRAVLTASLPAPIGSVEIESIADGGTVYMHSSLFAGHLPDGKEWMSIEPIGGSKEAAIAGNGDVEGQLEMLRAVSGNVETVAHEEVDGVPTTVYRGTTDPARFASKLRAEGREGEAQEYEQITKLAPTSATVYAWIDASGILRRTRIAMTIPSQSEGPDVTMDMRIDFSDFGDEPKIDVPGEGEVFDAMPIIRDRLQLAE